jgi:peptide/nickel transport system ATP-binding protein
VPSLDALPPGCTFAPRCPAATPECTAAEPGFADTDGHPVRCLTQVRDAAYDNAQEQTADNEVYAEPAPDDDLVQIDGLVCEFADAPSLVDRLSRRPPATVRAVDGVDLTVRRGEILGLVGESGSGKTTLGKALLGLAPVSTGAIRFEGQGLLDMSPSEWRGQRRRLQMIFQEAAGSLSPGQRVSQLVTEPCRIHRTPRAEQRSVDELLDFVGLPPDQAAKFPHQLSGGQARRVGVARALAVRPDFIVADEPTAGLDVSAAANVLNLLVDLPNKLGLSLLVITHDLNLVGYVADRIAVMRQGHIVELGNMGEGLERPRHDYTRDLLSSVPDLRPARGSVA